MIYICEKKVNINTHYKQLKDDSHSNTTYKNYVLPAGLSDALLSKPITPPNTTDNIIR